MPTNKVVIIGTGCAGLSAAYNLRKQGVDFILYEASGVVGGPVPSGRVPVPDRLYRGRPGDLEISGRDGC
jgi:uncharacterized protein with NAD-binding domain and iron-sulfur cluster